MRFYTFEEKRPEKNEIILVKIKEEPKDFYDESIKYYIVKCEYNKYKKRFDYVEAMGEQYAFWIEEDLLGWCKLEDIEREEKWS